MPRPGGQDLDGAGDSKVTLTRLAPGRPSNHATALPKLIRLSPSTDRITCRPRRTMPSHR